MFDTALLESRPDRKRRGKGAGLPLAIGLHVAVIGAFVGASAWSVGEPPEPVIPVIFMPNPAPPPPRGDGGHPRETTHVRRASQTASPTIAPPTNPDPVTANSAATEPDYPGEDTGAPAGDPSGVPEGTGETPPLDPGAGLLEGPHVIGGDVRAPVLIARAEPEYPEAARRAHLEGMVILEAVISAGGTVDEIRVVHSANPLLDAAAERAVRQWRYKPATLNGRAVSVYLTVTVTFGLRTSMVWSCPCAVSC
jgi:TonB family protein